MLDIMAVAGLVIIISLPFTIYIFDRWGFEEADHNIWSNKKLRVVVSLLTLVGMIVLLALPIGLYMMDH